MAAIETFTLAPWPDYSAQVIEQACEENRLEELLTELSNEILDNRSVSKEIKFETGCRAICMIPAEQSELIKKIATAFKTIGLWKLAKEKENPLHQILRHAQEQAVKQRNLPAALKLVSKARRYSLDDSLIENVLDFVPEKELIVCVAKRDCSNFCLWIRDISEDDASLFYGGGYRFLDPKKNDYREYSKFLDLLKPYAEQRRFSLSQATRLLMAPFDDHAGDSKDDIAAILGAFSSIPDTQLQECTQAALILSYDGLSGEDRAALVRTVADLPQGRRVALCQAAEELNLRSIQVRKFRHGLNNPPKNLLEWSTLLQFKKLTAKGMSKKTPDIYSVTRVIAILKALVDLKEPSFFENLSKIKLHVDAHQIVHRKLTTEGVCRIVNSIEIIEQTTMSRALSEFIEPEREQLIRKYWEQFGDIPVGDSRIRHFFCKASSHFHFDAEAG